MPLTIASASAGPPTQVVIPDCCNLGVVGRSLLAVNITILAAHLLQSPGWRPGALEFLETSMMVELACFWSLFLLCLLRRGLQRQIFSGSRVSLPVQRAVCALVPAIVTVTIGHLVVSAGFGDPGAEPVRLFMRALAASLFGAALQHYFELRTRAYSPALVEARLQALQARIRPHFLFNSLNAALSLIRTEPRRAESTLEDLAELFRVLMSDPRSVASLDEEIRLCEQYLSIEKIRLGDRLQVEWDTNQLSEQVRRRAQAPVLLLQPLLENAVHHGVEPVSDPALIRIRISCSLERIEVVVVNPYHGKSATAGNHMALDNIRERLALLYDVEAQLDATVRNGQFELRLRFPYVRA